MTLNYDKCRLKEIQIFNEAQNCPLALNLGDPSWVLFGLQIRLQIQL